MSLTSSCDDSTTEPTVNAQFNVSVAPDPVSAEGSTNDEFQWLASFTATFTETNGIGAAIESVDTEVIETVDGAAVDSEEEVVFQIQVDIENENNRIEGSSSKDLPISVFYTLPGGGTEATINLAFSILDDNGAEVGGTLQVRVE
jgi:hypothetical protein